MANEKIQKLQQQLSGFETKLQQYEKDFLANDGKIDEEEQAMLDAIRGLIEDVNKKLSAKTSGTSSDDNTESIQLPVAFEKGLEQLKTAVENLKIKIKDLNKSNKLESVKDKILAHVDKLASSISSIEKSYTASNDATQTACKAQIDSLNKELEDVKSMVSGGASFLDKMVDSIIPEDVQKSFKEKLNEIKNFIKSVDNDLNKFQKLADKIKADYNI